VRATVDQLKAFYNRPAGKLAVQHIADCLRHILTPGGPSDTILGIGYPHPYFERLALLDSRWSKTSVLSVTPMQQGGYAWPKDSKENRSLLADPHHLPVDDCCIDQVFLAHALEYEGSDGLGLREVWRILKPGGKLVVIAPNRSSLTTLFESTPFGNGRPFGRTQLRNFLISGFFEPLNSHKALILPLHQIFTRLEPIARKIAEPIGRVHISCARKTESSPAILGHRKKIISIPNLVSDLGLAGTSRGNSD